MRVASRRWLGVVVWISALAALAFFAIRSLSISTDLRSFMPPPQTADQKLLMDQIGEGPGTRLLLLSIEGAAPETLVALSNGLADALRHDAHFEQVLNGAFDVASLDPKWLPYRYLLSPTLDRHALDACSSCGRRDIAVVGFEQGLQVAAIELVHELLLRDLEGHVDIDVREAGPWVFWWGFERGLRVVGE